LIERNNAVVAKLLEHNTVLINVLATPHIVITTGRDADGQED
jgi:hypothetical protein